MNYNDYLEDFEELNTTTKTIYDLEDYDVLIIMNNGCNLTSWNDVPDKSQVLYVSEDLSKEDSLMNKYDDLTNVKVIIAQNVTDKVKKLYKMFAYCESLVSVIGMETWDVSEVTSLEAMFIGCSSLTKLQGMEDWDVSNVVDMTALFVDCTELENINGLNNWNTAKLNSMWSMLSDCHSLVDISAFKNWNVLNVTDMTSMFSDCKALTNLTGLEDWDVSNVEKMGSMFWECDNLEDISALSNWNTSSLKDICRMFRGCEKLTSLSALAKWDVSKVKEMTYTFLRCTGLTNLDALSDWDVSSVSNMRSMFDLCRSLENIDGLSSWNFDSILTVERMFDKCKSLVDVTSAEGWNLPDNCNSGAIFRSCPITANPFEKKLNINTHGPKKLVNDVPYFMNIYGAGWCAIQLGDIYSRASYITDVPGDCLTSIIYAIQSDCDFEVEFNAEGYSFTVRADNTQCYFNFHAGEHHAFDNMNKYDLALQIYKDINNNLGRWSNFYCGKCDLSESLNVLKELIDNDFVPIQTIDKNIHNFSDLDSLIKYGINEIVLENDILLDLKANEDKKYSRGIKIRRDDLVIDGNGYSIDACEKARIFNVDGENVTFKNLTFKHGYAEAEGGAIFNNNELRIENCEFLENYSKNVGGAIFTHYSSILTITDSKFHKNVASNDDENALGGVIYNHGGLVNISGSDFKYNTSNDGGTIVNSKMGKVYIESSIFSKNRAKVGGSIAIEPESITNITGTDFIDNYALLGGAIFSSPKSKLKIKKSLFKDNASYVQGGAIRLCDENDLIDEDCKYEDNRPDDIFVDDECPKVNHD